MKFFFLLVSVCMTIFTFNVFANDCKISIKAITKGGETILVDQLSTYLTDARSFASCGLKAKKILSVNYAFGERRFGTITDGFTVFSGKLSIYYFAEFRFDDYDYDLGLVDSVGRVQVNSQQIKKNTIRDEKGKALI